jgi:hypothetical protein
MYCSTAWPVHHAALRCAALRCAALRCTALQGSLTNTHCAALRVALQKGANEEQLQALRRDYEAKRAVQASRAEKVFFRVTVKVCGGGGVISICVCVCVCVCV